MRDSLSILKAKKCHKPGHVAGSCGHLQELRVTLINSHSESGTSVARSWILSSSSQFGKGPKPHDTLQPAPWFQLWEPEQRTQPYWISTYRIFVMRNEYWLRLINLWWFVTEQYKMNIYHLYTADSKICFQSRPLPSTPVWYPTPYLDRISLLGYLIVSLA